MVHYDVQCTFTDPARAEAVAEAWVAWLHAEHLQDVRDAGATSAAVVRLRDDGVVYEARYVFPSAEAFARYETEHAPRLRGEGLERFPLSLGLSYQRRVADLA